MRTINKNQNYLIIRGPILFSDLSSFTKIILSKLIELWCNYDELIISNGKLADMFNVTRRTIINQLNELQKLGLIEIIERYDESGSRLSNQIVLNEEKINQYFNCEIFEIEQPKPQQPQYDNNPFPKGYDFMKYAREFGLGEAREIYNNWLLKRNN